jgi:predicted TIM-barrel fold metal-dependent hydrolase
MLTVTEAPPAVPATLDWLISVDDHVIEPADLWQSRLPARYRSFGPRLEAASGGEVWVYEDKRVPTAGLSATAGKNRDDFSLEPIAYGDMRAGCYNSVARLDDMDRAGILASLCFPSFPRFCGQIFLEATDRDLALLCVRAYNDWMIDEWCGTAPGRFIPLIILPLWDPALAADEVRRCASKGAHALAFSEAPTPLGLPTIWDPDRYWDPVWAACAETDTVVCIHIGSSSHTLAISPDIPWAINHAWGPGSRIAGTMIEWLFGPPFRRFPNLKITLAEGGIGWIPYFLERATQIVATQYAGLSRGLTTDKGRIEFDPRRAIDVRGFDVYGTFRDHIFGCFIDDLHGVLSAHEIGINNIMVESDYPHSDSTWPDCIKHVNGQLDSNPLLTDHDKVQILRGNASRVFSFEPAPIPVP